MAAAAWLLCAALAWRAPAAAAETLGVRAPACADAIRHLWRGAGAQPDWSQRKIDVHEIPGRGRGWVAREPVRRGDVLIRLPAQSVLSVELGDRSEGELAVLLLRRLSEAGEERTGERSLWREYTSLVFPLEFKSAAFWTQEEIEEVQWPPVLRSLCLYAEHVQNAVRWTIEEATVTEEQARWAVGSVITRSFEIEGLGRVLAPLLDIFNHEPLSPADFAVRTNMDPTQPASPWQLTGNGAWLEMRAPRDVMAGEEVTISYGEDAGAELLAVHGFNFIPSRSNTADFIELFGSPDEMVAAVRALTGNEMVAAEDDEERWKLLDEAFTEMPLAIRPGGIEASMQLISNLEVALAEQEELPAFATVWSDAAGHGLLAPVDLPAPRRRQLRGQALQVASQAVRSALAYLPPLSDDAARLRALRPPPAEPSDPNRPRGRAELLAQFNLNLKRSLWEFVARVAAWEQR